MGLRRMALHTHGKCAIAIAVLPGRQDKHTRQLADVACAYGHGRAVDEISYI